MPKVCAKARNNDVGLPFNEREGHFPSGRGYAVDVRVRDWPGRAAQRYAEGAIIDILENPDDANHLAREVNSGHRYLPGHPFHDRAYGAIVIPAWNKPARGPMPWETRDGSAEMVSAYDAAGVPLPEWLQEILRSLDAVPGRDEKPLTEERSAEPTIESELPSPGDRAAEPTKSRGEESGSDTRLTGFAVDPDLLLQSLADIHVEEHQGRRAPYQYLVLLWAIASVRHGRRMIAYQEARHEIAPLLSTFRLAGSAPSPANPWFALKSSQWWEIQPPVPARYKDVVALNTVAGLRKPVYDLIKRDLDFADRAVDALVVLIGDSPDLQDFIVREGMSRNSHRAPGVATSVLIPVEQHTKETFTAEFKAMTSLERERREAKLQDAYEEFLILKGHNVSRNRITIDRQYLYTDLFDEDTMDLIEVKGSSDRVSMRLALGQILDYAECVEHKLRTVLVPEPPTHGILDLYAVHNVRVVWPSGDQSFEVWDG